MFLGWVAYIFIVIIIFFFSSFLFPDKDSLADAAVIVEIQEKLDARNSENKINTTAKRIKHNVLPQILLAPIG